MSGSSQTGLCLNGVAYTGSAYPDEHHQLFHPGGPILIGARGASSGSGTGTDPKLYVYSSYRSSAPCSGVESWNDNSGCGTDALIDFIALREGVYWIVTHFMGVYGPHSTGRILTFGLGPGEGSAPGCAAPSN